MTLRFYDVLEQLLKSLEEWRGNDAVKKRDVLDSVRERVLMLMTHVATTPLIGTAYAYPGDIDLDSWLEEGAAGYV
jgi:hypothetical protein